MRTRTKTNELSMLSGGITSWHDVDSNIPPNVNDYTYPSGSVIGKIDEETMIDDISKTRRQKQVFHQRRILERQRLDMETYWTLPGDKHSGIGPNAHWLAWTAYSDDLRCEHIRVEWSESEESLIRRTKKALIDVNQVDNLLNVVESPELITSIKPLFQKINSVKTVDLSGDLSKAEKKKQIKNLLRNAKGNLGILAGGFLYYSFGVAPLISDMRKISSSMSSLKKAADAAIRRAGELEIVHRQVTGKVSPLLKASPVTGLLPYAYGDVPGIGTWWHTNPLELVPPTRTVTVRGTRSSKFYSDLFGRMDYLISRFGVTGPASYAWERIPFSFVFDWFVDTSDVLNTIDQALTGSFNSIKDISISDRWRVLCPVVKHLRIAGEQSQTDGQQTALIELRQYHRKPIDPRTSAGLSGRFGKKQGLLTAALISQMAANLKKKVKT